MRSEEYPPTQISNTPAPPVRRGIRAQLTLALVGVAVPPALIFGLLAIARSRADVEREVARGHLAVVSTVGVALNQAVQDARRALAATGRILADDLAEDVSPAPAAPQNPADYTAANAPAPLAGPRTARFTRALTALKTEFPVLASVGLLDARGKLRVGKAPSEALRLQRANTYGGYVSEVYFENGRPHTAMVVQARDHAGGLRGFLVADVDLAFVQVLVSAVALGREAEVLVVDGAGRLVASDGLRGWQRTVKGQPLRATDPAVDQALGAYGVGRMIFRGQDGEERIAVFRNLADLAGERGLRWAVLVEQPTRAAFAVARQTTRDAILVLTGIVVLAILGGTLLARRLAQPLDRLAAGARALEAGNVQFGDVSSADMERGDEIGLLATAFSRMASRIGASQMRLDEANKFLEELVATIPVGVLSVDGHGIIRRMNRAQELLSGVAADHVRGLHVDVAFPELDPADGVVVLADPLSRALAGAPTQIASAYGAPSLTDRDVLPEPENNVVVFDETLRHARTRFSPERRVRSRVRMAHLAGISDGGAVIVQEDLSRQAALEDELRRAERLSSVGVLAAGVAHEINNPLTTILGYALLLAEDKPADHADLVGLTLVAEEAKRVQEIIRHLLDYSRLELGAREPCDLNGAVNRTLALTQPVLRKHRVEVSRELEPTLPAVRVDGPRLEQVFVNLIQNAVHAMEGVETRRLTVSTRLVSSDAPNRDGSTALSVAIEFCDTGPGITSENLARIFEPFFTTKAPGLGTGLGLAVARDIIADHGGELLVVSTLGEGSTFRVVLPT